MPLKKSPSTPRPGGAVGTVQPVKTAVPVVRPAVSAGAGRIKNLGSYAHPKKKK